MIALACIVPLLAGVAMLVSGTGGTGGTGVAGRPSGPSRLSGMSTGAAARSGVGASIVTLALLVAAWGSDSSVDIAWLPVLDLRLHLGLDGISGPLAVLAAIVTAAASTTLVAERPQGGRPAIVVGCLLLTLAGAVTTFAAKDALLFVVAFELVLVPVWVLITRFGDDRDPVARREAGARFVIYTGTGSTLMLLGVLLLVVRSGTADLAALGAAHGDGLSAGTQLTVAVLLTLGLAVKIPVWPLHSWLPLAHTTAPTAGSMLLAAVLLKMGTYGLVRLPLATVPDGFARIAPVLAVCGVVGIIWGGLVCLVERELKRLIAWSSIAHMGFVALALATGSATGVTAALYGNLAHGLISALLFLVVGGLKHRWGGDDLNTPRPALRDHAPVTGLLLLTGLAAGLGLPGLAGFWGEFPAIVAALGPLHGRSTALFATCAAIAAAGAVLAAAYALRVARLVWLGEGYLDAPYQDETDNEPEDAPDAETQRGTGTDEATATRTMPVAAERIADPGRSGELGSAQTVPGAVLALAVLALGVAPVLVLAVTEPALAAVVTR